MSEVIYKKDGSQSDAIFGSERLKTSWDAPQGKVTYPKKKRPVDEGKSSADVGRVRTLVDSK